MARRPTPPRPRPGAPAPRPPAQGNPRRAADRAPRPSAAEQGASSRRETSAAKAGTPHRQGALGQKSSSRRQEAAGQKSSAQRPKAAELKHTAQRAPGQGGSAAVRSGRSAAPEEFGQRGPTPARTDGPEVAIGRGRVVQAADRFGGMLRARPWRRRRRTIVLSAAGTVLLLIAVFVVAITIPPLRVHEVTVTGTGYVDASAVTAAAAPQKEHSMLLVRSGAVEKEVEKVPGVESAEVAKEWPSTLSVKVTERTPLATLKGADGSTHILDADGVELPEGAGKDQKLVPLTIGGKGGDTDAISGAMLSVLAALPGSMRSTVTGITASSPNDVTLTVKNDSGTKTIVWGNAQDSELKAKVATTLLTQPGKEIDVTSPVAPVTR